MIVSQESAQLPLEQIRIFTEATEAYRDQAAKHAKLGRFSLKERPSGYYQDFREVYFPPTETPDLELNANVGRMIMGNDENGRPHFDRFVDAFLAKPETLRKAREMINSGERIMIPTPHRELLDVALAMGGAQYALGNPELIEGTRLFTGPIVKELEIQGLDVIPVLQTAAGVIVAIPDTDSTDKQIEAGEVDATIKSVTNTAVSNLFQNQIVNGEIKLLVTAPSGSTDFESEDLILMKKVSRNTDILARRYFSALWPIVLVMTEGRTSFEVGDLMPFDKNGSLHDVMEDIMAPMYERVSGKKVIYQRPGHELATLATASSS